MKEPKPLPSVEEVRAEFRNLEGNPKRFGELLKYYREHQGLTMREYGQVIGTSQANISNIENHSYTAEGRLKNHANNLAIDVYLRPFNLPSEHAQLLTEAYLEYSLFFPRTLIALPQLASAETVQKQFSNLKPEQRFGAMLDYYRKALGYSAQGFAETTNADYSTLSLIENGKKQPTEIVLPWIEVERAMRHLPPTHMALLKQAYQDAVRRPVVEQPAMKLFGQLELPSPDAVRQKFHTLDNKPEKFGLLLKYYRSAMGLSQAALGARIGDGITQNLVNRIENDILNGGYRIYANARPFSDYAKALQLPPEHEQVLLEAYLEYSLLFPRRPIALPQLPSVREVQSQFSNLEPEQRFGAMLRYYRKALGYSAQGLLEEMNIPDRRQHIPWVEIERAMRHLPPEHLDVLEEAYQKASTEAAKRSRRSRPLFVESYELPKSFIKDPPANETINNNLVYKIGRRYVYGNDINDLLKAVEHKARYETYLSASTDEAQMMDKLRLSKRDIQKKNFSIGYDVEHYLKTVFRGELLPSWLEERITEAQKVGEAQARIDLQMGIPQRSITIQEMLDASKGLKQGGVVEVPPGTPSLVDPLNRPPVNGARGAAEPNPNSKIGSGGRPPIRGK